MPWQWEFLSSEPSDSSRIKLNIVWGPSDTAKGKCVGSSVSMDLLGEVSDEQLKESESANWPYGECRRESAGKKFVPYTNSCYEASKELSTLRRYKIVAQYKNVSCVKRFQKNKQTNKQFVFLAHGFSIFFVCVFNKHRNNLYLMQKQQLPDSLSKLIWKLYASYDLIGGNSSNARKSDEVAITASFPKESEHCELELNGDRVAVEFDSRYVDAFLTRTRIHKYTELDLFRMFSSK